MEGVPPPWEHLPEYYRPRDTEDNPMSNDQLWMLYRMRQAPRLTYTRRLTPHEIQLFQNEYERRRQGFSSSVQQQRSNSQARAIGALDGAADSRTSSDFNLGKSDQSKHPRRSPWGRLKAWVYDWRADRRATKEQNCFVNEVPDSPNALVAAHPGSSLGPPGHALYHNISIFPRLRNRLPDPGILPPKDYGRGKQQPSCYRPIRERGHLKSQRVSVNNNSDNSNDHPETLEPFPDFDPPPSTDDPQPKSEDVAQAKSAFLIRWLYRHCCPEGRRKRKGPKSEGMLIHSLRPGR